VTATLPAVRGAVGGELVFEDGALPSAPMALDASEQTLVATLGPGLPPGVYSVAVRSTGPDGSTSPLSQTAMLVVYDPDGGSVSGGGWLYPAADDELPNADARGKAHFGFQVRYRNGRDVVPAGQASFRYRAGALELESRDFQWLVVATPNSASFRGEAEVTHVVDGRERTDVLDFRIVLYDGDERDNSEDEFGITVFAPDGGILHRVKRAVIEGGNVQVKSR
jgi:hypothetical protein